MKRRLQSGFSLLELLVALFVVMIITSLVTLNVNSGGQDIKLEAQVRNVADIASYALDEAQLRNADIGMFIEKVYEDRDERFRYSWLQRYEEGWRSPELDRDIYATSEFPEGVELRLELEDLTPVEFEPLDEGIDPIPQVIFFASGETLPGLMELRRSDTGELLWVLEWDLLGRFTLLLRGERLDDDDRE